jgi:hypothetical protein
MTAGYYKTLGIEYAKVFGPKVTKLPAVVLLAPEPEITSHCVPGNGHIAEVVVNPPIVSKTPTITIHTAGRKRGPSSKKSNRRIYAAKSSTGDGEHADPPKTGVATVPAPEDAGPEDAGPEDVA